MSTWFQLDANLPNLGVQGTIQLVSSSQVSSFDHVSNVSKFNLTRTKAKLLLYTLF